MTPRKKITRGVHYFRNHPNSLLRIAVGALLILSGIAGIVLPILGIWLIPLGLFILAADFPWAHRLHVRLSGYVRTALNKIRSFRNKTDSDAKQPLDQ